MFARLLISCACMGAGILTIKYRKQIMDWTGHWGWAERYLGNTVNAIILIGLLLMFFSVAYPTGSLDRYLPSDTHELGSQGKQANSIDITNQ